MKKIFLTIVFIITTILLIFVLSKSEFKFENNIQDLYIKTFAKSSTMDNIKLIIIDDKSTEKIRYPWARDMYTDIFAYLKDYAKIIVFDSVIDSESEYFPNEDKIFFNNIKNFPNLLSGYMFDTKEKVLSSEQKELFKSKNKTIIKDNRTIVPEDYISFSNMPEKYLENIPNLGYIDIYIDSDGVLRTFLPVKNYDKTLYPSLALQAYSMATGVNNFVLNDKFLCSDDNCQKFKMPIYTTRENYSGVFGLVNWYKTEQIDTNTYFSHKAYSAIDIYNSYLQTTRGEKPLISPEEFKDSYVFVGSCANNQLIKDKKITPISNMHAGIDYQATVFENMMTGKFSVKMNTLYNLLIIAFLGFITLLCILKTPIKITLATTGSLIITYYFLTIIMIQSNIIMLLITPLIVEMLIFCIGYSYKFFIENKLKQKLQKAMGQYLSKDIMKKVVKDMDNIKIGGKRADVSIMFIDIRGFTSITEQMPPEGVTGILNEYIATVEPLIRKHNGVINKFIGDAVMAVFGDPIADKNHAINVVLCADEVIKAMKKLKEKFLSQGKPEIEIGIGICTGEVFVGNIGTAERLEYTVIGDAVNLANRIEACNKIYKTKFLISEETYSRTRDIVEVIPIRDVEIQGKAKNINIYEVLRITQCQPH